MDKELLQGARNAVRVCMKVESADRVFILTDKETMGIAQALKDEARAVGAETLCVSLEEFGPRPVTLLPDGLAKRLTLFIPTVTFYAATIKENELGLRSGLINLVLGKLGARHGHMPGISAQIMREGMRADYYKVNELTMRVYESVRQAKTIHVTSADGTDFTAHFDGKFNWLPEGGLYHKPRSFGNLPEGEVLTCPASVEGVFTARVLGDYFSAKYGVLAHTLTLEIGDTQVKNVRGDQEYIAAELNAYLDSAENGRRIGEFAIGTNIGIQALCGNMLQDEKIPGVHIATGDPLGFLTGADWSSKVHVDAVNPRCTIKVDGKPLMKEGHYLI